MTVGESSTEINAITPFWVGQYSTPIVGQFSVPIYSIAIIKAAVLFLGLQGTIFLASALSPPHDAMKLYRPKGLLRKLKYELTEGRKLSYPINYNPMFFYGGLLLLALSFVLSAVPSSNN